MSYEHPLWVKEAARAMKRLLVFRTLMVRLEIDHPDIYPIVKDLHATIDTRQQSLYDGHKVNQTNNGSTTSQPSQK